MGRGERGLKSSIQYTVQSATQRLLSATKTKFSTFTMCWPVQHPRLCIIHVVYS